MWLIGLLQLEGWLQEERFTQFRGQSLANGGIFIQEHLLAVLPKELLERWFPQPGLNPVLSEPVLPFRLLK